MIMIIIITVILIIIIIIIIMIIIGLCYLLSIGAAEPISPALC